MARPLLERFLSKVVQAESCWKWIGGMSTSGYGSFNFNGTPMKAHRAAYLLFVGEIPTVIDGSDSRGSCVIHSCDNRLCVNPAHLRIGTHQDNMTDKAIRGRVVSNSLLGEKHQNSKLKAGDISDIRFLRGLGVGITEIGRLFGVSHSTIHCVVTGATWSHI